MIDAGEFIAWIRDISIIIFAITATSIALLAYKRARDTVFSPVKKEVARKQVRILANVLAFLRKKRNSTAGLYDFADLVSLNIEIILDHIGLKKLTDEDRASVNNRLQGWAPFYAHDRNEITFLTGNLDDFNTSIQAIDRHVIQENIVNLIGKKEGSGLPVLFFTKNYHEAVLSIDKFLENPLLPSRVYGNLFALKYYGKRLLLDNVEKAVLEYIIRYSELVKTGTLNPENLKLIDTLKKDAFRPSATGDAVETLRKEIEKYLGIK